MGGKGNIKIEFVFDEKNLEVFKQALLFDDEAREKMNARGGSIHNFIKNDSWHSTFICKYNKKPAGIMRLGVISGFSLNFIDELYILPKFRNKGIAKKLLNFGIDYCDKSWDGHGVAVYTIENEKMESLLPKLGFKNRGTYKGLYNINNRHLSQSLWVKQYD